MSSPGTIYEASIFTPEESIDNLAVVRLQYSMYLFRRELIHQDGTAEPFFSESSWLWPCYFSSSFGGSPSCDVPTLKPWLDALWEIREQYGQEFGDKLMYYAFATRHNVFKQHKTFDSFFVERITNAISVLGNSSEDREKVITILKKHGVSVAAD